METSMNETYTKLSDAEPTSRVRSAGVATLALMFLASGGLTVAYLSDTHATQAAAAQTAAAAAAATIPDPFSELTLQAQSAYVLDLATGHILYSLNPDVQLPLASLTKVPMALAVSQVLSPDSIITIPYDTSPPGSAERLAKGQTWTVRNVLNFTLTASSNDGADILAAAANDDIKQRYPEAPKDGTEAATLWRMNDIARGLGLTHTYFLNANGLDLSLTQSGAYGSAHDVAYLFAYAATSSPEVFAGTTQNDLLLTSLDGSKTSAFNTDTALGSIHGLIMGKTGYTDLAGGNLAIVFDVGPAHPVVAVVLHSTQEGRFDDMKKIVTATESAIALGR